MIVCLICPLGAAIVDRMAVIVGQQTITQLQLDEEIRVTALLNQRPVARDAETRRAAADRLVEQLLIRREMEQSRYPLPSEQEVNQYVEQIRTQNGGQAGLAKALATHDVTESTLRQHLEFFLACRLRCRVEVDFRSSRLRETSQTRRCKPSVRQRIFSRSSGVQHV